MSNEISRRHFMQVAAVGALGGVLVACAPPGGAGEAPAGAAGSPAEASITLDYYWVGNADTDQRPLVEDAINEYIGPLLDAKVSFHIIGWGDWASKAVTGMQAGEKIDIIFTADWWHYMQFVGEGLLRPLNDDDGEFGNLLQQYGSDIVSSLNPAFITGTQVDGVNYAVPTNKELCVPTGFIYNVTWAEEIGFTAEDAANIKSYADMEPWLEKAKAAYPDEYPYLTDGSDGFFPWVPGFASGVDDRWVNMPFAPASGGSFDETISIPVDSDWFRDRAATMRKWYDNGWIHPDSGLDTFNTSELMNAGKFFIHPQPLKGNNIKAQELVNSSGNDDLRLGEIYGQPKINITVHSGGSMLAIPMLSEHPVEAMKYINLMHNDPKLVNLMLFGVEGVHWEAEADGRVKLMDNAWYSAHPGAWTVGNTAIQAVTNKEDPQKNIMLQEYSKDAIDHASLGFRFRTEPVAAELTALGAASSGILRGLLTGYIDPATELQAYLDALKAAGIDKVRDEVEKQYLDWKAAKGNG
jgi:putative aldouronate transport system substrate-binding protein